MSFLALSRCFPLIVLLCHSKGCPMYKYFIFNKIDKLARLRCDSYTWYVWKVDCTITICMALSTFGQGASLFRAIERTTLILTSCKFSLSRSRSLSLQELR